MMDNNKGSCSTSGKRMSDNTGIADVQERMDVIASCGKKIGVVDHVEGNAIKLTKHDSPVAGQRTTSSRLRWLITWIRTFI